MAEVSERHCSRGYRISISCVTSAWGGGVAFAYLMYCFQWLSYWTLPWLPSKIKLGSLCLQTKDKERRDINMSI